MDKNSIILYTDYMEQLELLSFEQRGILLTAIMKYQKYGEIIEMDDMTKMAFSFIRAQLDRDNEKYNETVKKRREAGRRGGMYSKQTQAKQANANFAYSNEAKQANASDNDNVVVNDNDNDNDNVVVNVNDNSKNNNNGDLFNFLKEKTEILGGDVNAVYKKLSGYLGVMDFSLIEKAIEISTTAKNPSWNYAFRVMDSWKEGNILTVSDWERHEKQREEKIRSGTKQKIYEFSKAEDRHDFGKLYIPRDELEELRSGG